MEKNHPSEIFKSQMVWYMKKKDSLKWFFKMFILLLNIKKMHVEKKYFKDFFIWSDKNWHYLYVFSFPMRDYVVLLKKYVYWLVFLIVFYWKFQLSCKLRHNMITNIFWTFTKNENFNHLTNPIPNMIIFKIIWK